MSESGSIIIIACFVLSGIGAFVGLSKREDGNTRMPAIAALTLGLFLGFSIAWTIVAAYLKLRFAEDETIQVPYWGFEIGVLVASVLCGVVFARPSFQGAQPSHLTTIQHHWMTSPRAAFRTGFIISLLVPAGFAGFFLALFVASELFT